MIRIGPAGIPLSCKGRTLKDGIIYTKSLELDALEVQFVRGIRMTEEDAAEVGEVAEAADVELHVHAPYYTNLAGDERNLTLSREKVMKAANLANIMGAQSVVVHPGFYGDQTPEQAMERMVQVCGDFRDEFKSNNWTPKLALETMGKRAVFGSLEEIVDLCKQVDGILPVVDFAHIHARGNGSLNTVEDFQEVFDQLIPLGIDHYLVHFTGVLYENGNERHHLPIKKGDLRFEPLVEVILENDYNVTLISTSPILEHDAMYMQIVLDRVKEKREQRLQKEVLKAKEDEEKAAQAAIAAAEAAKAEEEARKQREREEKERLKREKEKAKELEPRPQCAALTQSGNPCQNPARTGSKYCSSHKGYRPNKVAKKAKATKGTGTSRRTTGKAVKKSASTNRGSAKKARREVKRDRKTKKSSAAKPAAKKAAAKKPAKKTAAKKTPAKKAPAKKPVKKAAAKKAPAKKAASKKAATKKAAAKKTPTKKTPVKEAASKGAKKTPSKGATTKGKTQRAKTTPAPDPTPASSRDTGATGKTGTPGVKSRLKAAAGRFIRRKEP